MPELLSSRGALYNGMSMTDFPQLTNTTSPTSDGMERPKVTPVPILSDDAVANLVRFFAVVERIVRRLLADGYTIKDGVLIPPKERRRK